ncbi:MAG: hypothetical protein OXE93_03085 [bacterium]|nr:hypothetical protein [bacterium]
MYNFNSSEAAKDIFAIEEISVGPIQKIGTVLLAWIVAIVTLGGGTTPISRQKILIRHIASNIIVIEIDDSVADISATIFSDLNELSAEAFTKRWFPNWKGLNVDSQQ